MTITNYITQLTMNGVVEASGQATSGYLTGGTSLRLLAEKSAVWTGEAGGRQFAVLVGQTDVEDGALCFRVGVIFSRLFVVATEARLWVSVDVDEV